MKPDFIYNTFNLKPEFYMHFRNRVSNKVFKLCRTFQYVRNYNYRNCH